MATETSWEQRPPSRQYNTYNDTGATLVKSHLVLDEVIVQFGDVTDKDGILNEAHGLIDCGIGRVLQTTQILDGLTGMERNDPVYMAPGSGTLHAIPAEGDYVVSKIWRDQGATEEFIVIQTICPVAYSELET